MNIEIDINDARAVKNILEVVLAEWKNKTPNMIDDKNCSVEIYNEHLDSVNSLGIMVEAIKEQL
jgi:hypothetical protein